MIPIGAFTLHEIIGTGGMGQVWRAVHTAGHPAAVKVLTATNAQREEFRTAFSAEVRAAAWLDHPDIVDVYDTGVTTEETADGSAGQIGAGMPWMAMELVPGKPILQAAGLLSWHQAHGVLLRLLDALAHAHSRGVIHRDVKPGNLLASSDLVRLSLTDFGIAQARSQSYQDPLSLLTAGTPSYMPPEQGRGEVRDQGPWTDLYAVGRLAMALLTGKPHREATDYNAVPGFKDWHARMVAPDPRDRYPTAAHAIAGLLALADSTSGPGPQRRGTAGRARRGCVRGSPKRPLACWARRSCSSPMRPTRRR